MTLVLSPFARWDMNPPSQERNSGLGAINQIIVAKYFQNIKIKIKIQ